MKYTNLQHKYTLTIPDNTTVLYCNKNKVVTFIGLLKKKSLKVKLKLFFIDNLMIISNLPNSNKNSINKKELKMIQGTTLSLIKHILIEINYKLYQRLKFIGVGYRAFQVDKPLENQILLKLGYSHVIYFTIPTPIETYNIKYTKLFIFGNCSYNEITQLASSIRNCKLPEPYKGKGILYYEEKIKLKKGKKI